ncbi:hypothetical protein M3D15_08355 [Pseudoclavibacter alba]|uniref:Uncharacterized protein n=1 Tax=Pseudoclavibacter albus TaxID=272241 RepID=A0ABT2HYF3_9MICO|nr:hypothetical protein [Pseudoclavibacter alba]MCT2043340.1 hypothetical protein [Pseudoclavibacter alba]
MSFLNKLSRGNREHESVETDRQPSVGAAADVDLVFVPALVTLLAAAESERGRPLTQPEVEALRDNATTVALPAGSAAAMAASRGYPDLDPLHVWDEWQRMREQLASGETN